jgi:hypothetical protein
VALIVVGGFAELAHEVLVRHAICAEHGELIELSGAVRTSSEAEVRSADTPRSSTVGAASDDQAGHEHCPVAFLAKGRTSLQLDVLPEACSEVGCVAGVVAPADREQGSVPLLLLAPKHSPPGLA